MVGGGCVFVAVDFGDGTHCGGIGTGTGDNSSNDSLSCRVEGGMNWEVGVVDEVGGGEDGGDGVVGYRENLDWGNSG